MARKKKKRKKLLIISLSVAGFLLVFCLVSAIILNSIINGKIKTKSELLITIPKNADIEQIISIFNVKPFCHSRALKRRAAPWISSTSCRATCWTRHWAASASTRTWWPRRCMPRHWAIAVWASPSITCSTFC